MNRDTFSFLRSDIWYLFDSACGRPNRRIRSVLRNAVISRFIDIYRHQTDYSEGLLNLSGFGKSSFRELDCVLKGFGLPSLIHSDEVVREFDHLCSSPSELISLIGSLRSFDEKDGYLQKLVLKNVFKTLGLRYDSVSILEVLKVIS